MDFNNLLLGGGVIAGITAVWQYIRIGWSKFYGMFVVSLTVERQGSEALLMYLTQTFKTTRLGNYRYVGVPMRTRRSWRNQLVFWEVISSLGNIFWRKWRPIWATWKLAKDDEYELTVYPSTLTLSFFRGTFQRETLLLEAQEFWNEFMRDADHDDRYFIERIVGINKRAAYSGGSNKYEAPRSKRSNDNFSVNTFRAARPIGIDRQEVGHHAALLGIRHLALAPHIDKAVQEARHWEGNRDWYQIRGLPWKLGWVLYGSPGNGKTTLARAIAEELRLPIYIYDLASMANDELISAWSDMQAHTPCVALFEDIDAVFHARENVANKELTFDCLLNCLDGVEQADGVFTIMTTNNIELVDPALGRSTADGGSTRPGRISRVLEMTPPDAAGRMLIAQRILMDWPNVWEQVVAEGAGDSGDQFQARCFKYAEQREAALWQNAKELLSGSVDTAT